MKQYRLVNNVLGWIVFAIAAFTYCSTVEPTASFWDCPEFISTAFKLDVGHPPGAPFFMLAGNLFTQFTSDPAQVALMVNIMSALLSAFCILFLFWSVTHLARRLILKDGAAPTWQQTLLIMACGVAGALVYTWSDTFWFSAEEGEVYAFSSMFTALVFWLILKWEDHADEPGSDRWLVLIFYLTGLSIGVHLLNLLCLPAITLVYYYRKNPQANAKGSLIALVVSFALVAAVLYGVVPGIVKVGGWFELFFVNTLGLSFNTGMVIYIIVLIAVVLAAIWSTTRKNRTLINALFLVSVALLGIPFYDKGFTSLLIGIVVLVALFFLLRMKRGGEFVLRKRVLNTSLLCMLMLMIGYSTYAVIIIRSTANPPMDQNSPEDIFTLGQYLNREQYGSRPLFYGESYLSQPVDFTQDERVQRHEKQSADEPDRYDEVTLERSGYRYPGAMKMFFPRMYSPNHASSYESWLGGVSKRSVNFTYEDQQGYTRSGYGEMPTQLDNLRFFFSYQVNFMYWRYFMWNFAGRQNDIQGFGEPEHGNWITGIPFFDNWMYGDQSLLPKELSENKGHNVFYCLPLLLGLFGLFWQAYRGKRGIQQFWVVFFLFFMTGLAIVFYLNQTPMQPRERDYAYAGSFYAFSIWVGLGVAGVAALLRRIFKNDTVPNIIASVVAVAVPLQMVSQTWDDHDRTGRYACRDFGLNYLMTLPDGDGPLIYTNGDNDTFPLWYNQEVEGVRTDARVCNLSYLQTDWYTDQMVRPAYDSPAMPIAWNRYEYVDNMGHDFFRIDASGRGELEEIKRTQPEVNPFDLKYIIDNYARKGKPLPTDSVVVSVNKENVINSGMMLPNGPDSIPDYITISWKGKTAISKSEMMVLEMLVRNDWKRPLYMSVTLGSGNYANLEPYLVLEGLAYRITPFALGMGTIDADKMYNNMMNRFKFGNVNDPKIYLDETNMRMCRTHRHMFNMLARELLNRGDKDRALKAMTKCEKELPGTTIPYNSTDIELADLWLKIGDKTRAAVLYEQIAKEALAYLRWANTLSSNRLSQNARECAQQLQVLYACLGGLEECGSKNTPAIRQQAEAMDRSESFMAAYSVLERQYSNSQSSYSIPEADYAESEGVLEQMGL